MVREGLETALDSWLLAEDLCVAQWYAHRCMLYPHKHVPIHIIIALLRLEYSLTVCIIIINIFEYIMYI